MPFVVVLIIKALWDNRKILKKKVLIGLSILFCIVISYPLVIGMQGGFVWQKQLESEYRVLRK